jgi:hypothetical protein
VVGTSTHPKELSMKAADFNRVRIPPNAAGRWYIKFIHMTQVNEPPVNYESRWARLTFELR